jgi:hypothetical protein
MHPARSIAVLLAAIAAAASAHAQTIWRCADGYSQQPCPGGTALPPAPPAPAVPARAGDSVGERDRRLADTLERERLQREAQAQATPSLYLPAPATEPMEGYKSPEKKATRKLDVFTASVPGSGKKQAGKDKGKAGSAKAGPPAMGAASAKDAGGKPARKKEKG